MNAFVSYSQLTDDTDTALVNLITFLMPFDTCVHVDLGLASYKAECLTHHHHHHHVTN
jgi:hypothetical protein